MFKYLAVATTITMTIEAVQILRKYNKLVVKYNDSVKKGRELDEQMSYMVHILNNRKVGLSEFDLIALPSVCVDDPKEP